MKISEREKYVAELEKMGEPKHSPFKQACIDLENSEDDFINVVKESEKKNMESKRVFDSIRRVGLSANDLSENLKRFNFYRNAPIKANINLGELSDHFK